MDPFSNVRSTTFTVAPENKGEQTSHTVAGAPDRIAFRIAPRSYP